MISSSEKVNIMKLIKLPVAVLPGYGKWPLKTEKIEWKSMYVWENNLEINLPVGPKVRLLRL